VEDNPDTRELLREQLEDDRFEVFAAKDGQDAILRVGERAPDVVIMDVMMPQLDGYETSRYLKLRFRDRFIPIMMLTARSDDASREEGARYGCEDYRCKPYTRQDLLASVEALLALGRFENRLFASGNSDADGMSLEAVRQKIVESRLRLAERQIEERSFGIARGHLERVLAISAGHEQALALLNRLDAGGGDC